MGLRALVRVVGLSIFVGITLCIALKAQGPKLSDETTERRIDEILSKLTIDEKLAMLGGEDTFYTHAVPRASIPSFKMSDGPMGTRTYGPAPAYAAGVSLAATWDPALAQRVGTSLGQDARARGIHFLLAPGVNIYRMPLNGRNMEYFGEDPYLASKMAVSYINGVQSQGVSATVKHFAANNSEYDRHKINAIVDERTLREIYLPAFEAAVKEAHVGAVMDSYNRVNGDHSTQNAHLNIDILKKEWGFSGLLMSDWDATYDGVAAANNGLDLEMPFAKLMTVATLKAALAAGTVKESTIDDKIRRLLRVALQFGWLDRDQLDTGISLNHPEADVVALDSAREAITLLKNEHSLLPLDVARIKTIAVIGPNAVQAVVGGGGSSEVTPFRADGIVAGLTNYLGQRARVVYVAGFPKLSDLFRETTLTHFTATVPNAEKGKQSGTGHINSWDGLPDVKHPASGTINSYSWEGVYTPAEDATYLVFAGAPLNDEFQLYVNDRLLLSRPEAEADQTASAQIPLRAGQAVKVRLEYKTHAETPAAGLGICKWDDLLQPASKTALRDADAVLLASGFDDKSEGESNDRPYQMPGLQDELISAVTQLNPKSIVLITSGSSVKTSAWIDRVPAILDDYFSGQDGAQALAEVIFGERSPEGHLPFTWERELDENPSSKFYREEGGDKDSHYGEGLMVGYRYYATAGKNPLFAFGTGLSYTRFQYTNLKVEGSSPDDVNVSFDVKNAGDRHGATVAQLYVGDPSAKAQRPSIELKGFRKVWLKPGEQEHVLLHLDRRAFEYYDVSRHDWAFDPGQFAISVGESAGELDLQATATLR